MQRVIVPAREGRAVALAAGQALRVINTHGNQVLDTWAFVRGEPAGDSPGELAGEFMSMAHTRSFNSRIYVRAGDGLISNHRRAVLRIEQDSSPGRHDILLCACNLWIYRELGVTGYHRSCSDNLHEALAALGLRIGFTPSPLNLFMNVPVAADGALDRLAPVSRPGDHVLLRALVDVVVAISACPQDITAVNAGQPRDAALEVVD